MVFPLIVHLCWLFIKSSSTNYSCATITLILAETKEVLSQEITLIIVTNHNVLLIKLMFI